MNIRKYQFGGFSKYYNLDNKNTRKAVNEGTKKFANAGLNILGMVGDLFSSVFTGTPTTTTNPKTISPEMAQQQKQSIQKGMTWLSPFNYGTALVTGHGLNAKKGEEQVAKWDPRLQLIGRLGELYAGPKAIRGVSKGVKKGIVANEFRRTVNKGIRTSPQKTSWSSYQDFRQNGFNGQQLLERSWLDKELETGDPNTMVHYDFGDHKSSFRKNNGAYVKDNKLIPGQSSKKQANYIWWGSEGPWQHSQWMFVNPELKTPTRYISTPKTKQFLRVNDHPEKAIGQNQVAPETIMDNEFVTEGPVNLSNASILQKDPLGWWGRVKYVSNSSDWTKNLPGKRDYSMSRKIPYSGYTPTKQNPSHYKFVRDVMQGYRWGINRNIKSAGNKDFTQQLKGKERLGYGAENDVYEDTTNPQQVLKVPGDRNGLVTPHSTQKGAIREGQFIISPFNRLPFNLPLNIEGTIKTPEGKYIPVFSQRKVYIPKMDQKRITDFDKSVNGMYSLEKPDINNILLENDIQGATDFKLPNIGLLPDGTVMGIDLWGKNSFIKTSQSSYSRYPFYTQEHGVINYPYYIKLLANRFKEKGAKIEPAKPEEINKESYYQMLSKGFVPMYRIHPGKVLRAHGQEILRRMQNYGMDVENTMGELPLYGKKSIKDLITLNSGRSSFLGYYDEPGTGGTYFWNTGTSIVDPGPNSTFRQAAKRTITNMQHERNMHGTQALLTPEMWKPYENFLTKIFPETTTDEFGRTIVRLRDEDLTAPLRSKDSPKKEELRATLGEYRKNIYDNVAHPRATMLDDLTVTKADLEELRPYYEAAVDELTLPKVREDLRKINSYGEDYAAFAPNHPNFLEELKWLLKYAPAAGTPLIFRYNEKE